MKRFEIVNDLENKLSEHGFCFIKEDRDRYRLINDCNKKPIQIQLIVSDLVKGGNSISPNGNLIQSIVLFRLGNLIELERNDYFILGFQYSDNKIVDYVLMSSEELKRKIKNVWPRQLGKQSIEFVLWLMPDRTLYDCTNLGLEGEWYYLSKGMKGRIADKTNQNYSEFLNDWARLKAY